MTKTTLYETEQGMFIKKCFLSLAFFLYFWFNLYGELHATYIAAIQGQTETFLSFEKISGVEGVDDMINTYPFAHI